MALPPVLNRMAWPNTDPHNNDANIKLTDDEYLKDTIRIMYKHANKGVVLLLTSNLLETDDGLINRSPSDILNWALKEFGSVALDHSFSDELFILVIYK